MKCLNPECLRESCRLCKETSHIPLRCDEVERADEVDARLAVEKKMTEALLRTCWKCKRQFFKEEVSHICDFISYHEMHHTPNLMNRGVIT
jgi:TRIAD3 protein (E3 ubiquitin-protein ligase RNF216)